MGGLPNFDCIPIFCKASVSGLAGILLVSAMAGLVLYRKTEINFSRLCHCQQEIIIKKRKVDPSCFWILICAPLVQFTCLISLIYNFYINAQFCSIEGMSIGHGSSPLGCIMSFASWSLSSILLFVIDYKMYRGFIGKFHFREDEVICKAAQGVPCSIKAVSDNGQEPVAE